MRLPSLVVAGAAIISLIGCADLPVIEADVCGNAVVETPLEDCDTFVDPRLKGAVCRPKGVVGACHFDCRLDADGTRAVCPEGMGCAADGICRRPTGDFQLPPSKLSSDVSSWLSSADFDGDGRPEVISAEPADQLQEGHFRLHYFDADAKLVETRSFPRATTRPIVTELTGDQRRDLVFSNLRVGMVPGRKDRAWIPATFSSYVVTDSVLRILPLSKVVVDQALALAAFAKLDEVPGIYVPSSDSGKLALKAALPRPLEALAGQPLAADILDVAASPCQEVVFAFSGDDSFRLLDMCRLGKSPGDQEIVWRDAPAEQVVRLPHGAKIVTGPIAADVDGDGHLDILIGARDASYEGEGSRCYVTHGDGTQLQDTAEPFTIPLLSQTDAYALPMPLAAGDITGDGVADYVLPSGVLGSRSSLIDGSLGYFTSYANSAQRWSMAQVLDLNGNGLADVIAASEGAPGLSFLSGTGGPFVVPDRISSQGPVRLIGTGDFDGDLIDDVAFVAASPGQASLDSLAIAYGSRDRAPEAPVRIAELDGVEQLGSVPDGGVDDVFTTSSVQQGGVLRSTFTLFGGDADRLPFAPYTLVTFATDGSLLDWAAPALMVGAFSAPGSKDVVALGTHDYTISWNQWLIPDIGGGQRPPRLLDGAPPDAVLPFTRDRTGLRLSVAGVAADLDGDGLDEALWLMPRQLPEGPSACTLLIYDVDPSANRASLKSQLDFDEPCATPELLATRLGDKEGPLQLLALLGDPEQGPRTLEILWNDGAGGFSSARRTLVQDRKRGDVRAFSVYPDGSQIAFVTDAGLHLATPHEGSEKLDSVTDVTTFDDPRGVVVTDPNGDGLTDVVVADAEGLWLLQAELR